MICLHPWVPRSIGIGALFLVFLTAWGTYTNPESFWAPGDLSRYHTDIDSCLVCHVPLVGPTSERCVKCHSPAWFHRHAQLPVTEFHDEIINKSTSCSICHVEHLGVLNNITLGAGSNPHGEFIFRATDTSSCSDCHLLKDHDGQRVMTVLANEVVQHLYREGEGFHRQGQIARCLLCHRGGQFEIDEDEREEDDEEDD